METRRAQDAAACNQSGQDSSADPEKQSNSGQDAAAALLRSEQLETECEAALPADAVAALWPVAQDVADARQTRAQGRRVFFAQAKVGVFVQGEEGRPGDGRTQKHSQHCKHCRLRKQSVKVEDSTACLSCQQMILFFSSENVARPMFFQFSSESM